MNSYSAGLHILVEASSKNVENLSTFKSLKPFLDNIITYHNLQMVGSVYYDFENGGFTAVICLTESHISIHTWPEFGRLTYDVFLSNYTKNNEPIVRDIHEKLQNYFEVFELNTNELHR